MALTITEAAMVALLNQLTAEEASRDELDDPVDEIVLPTSGYIRQAIHGLVLGEYAIDPEMREWISHGYVRERR